MGVCRWMGGRREGGCAKEGGGGSVCVRCVCVGEGGGGFGALTSEPSPLYLDLCFMTDGHTYPRNHQVACKVNYCHFLSTCPGTKHAEFRELTSASPLPPSTRLTTTDKRGREIHR